MKRASEVVYTSVTPFNLDVQTKPTFNFSQGIKLVEYSFSDDDIECDTDTEIQYSLRSLQSSLAQLGSPLPSVQFKKMRRLTHSHQPFTRNIKTRISLSLREEEEAELRRKERVISKVERCLLTSGAHVCEAEAPAKRRRLDSKVNIWTNVTSRRFSLRRRNKPRKTITTDSSKERVSFSQKILAFLRK